MLNYFILFDIEANYSLDIAKLKKKYLKLAAEFHPDRAESEKEKIIFLEKSMHLNEAYMSLIDEYKRAQHLLMIKGALPDEEEARGIVSPQDLEQIWDLNDELESASELQTLFAFEKKVLSQKDFLVAELTNDFSEGNIEKGVELTVKLKYLTDLVKNIRLKIKDANN